MIRRHIRPAKSEDLAEILKIYAGARHFMAQNGNPNQWADSYPSQQLLESDIQRNVLYVVSDEAGLWGVFAFILGDDPTYKTIENGSWRSDESYGTIHRIASCSSGVFADAFSFCRSKSGHLRIDTHQDNAPMQHLAEKYGFQRRGIIYVADGTPRIAYDWLAE